MAGRRLTIRNARLSDPPAVTVNPSVTWHGNLVYFIASDSLIRYPIRKSRILYIGTTNQGSTRVFSSIAAHVGEAFRIRNVRKLTVHCVSCKRVRNVKTWRKLERACLLAFRERHGSVPKLN